MGGYRPDADARAEILRVRDPQETLTELDRPRELSPRAGSARPTGRGSDRRRPKYIYNQWEL
ncbi:hypothetical protein Asi03nite_60390 [Actinoplanes siamensis]|uniref:Uncharacterized protein n=1 Tax=Actinoplanes siamensis TaxID=1223317 RepID=A0A919NCB5_9ACTN|nr:hypothetical protein Asi03nite_60390 [Actinoplanes siamensis]